MSKEWSMSYASLKGHILSLHSKGVPVAPAEMQSCTQSLNTLKHQLRPMIASPLEHGLVASEAARREVLLENLQTLLISGGITTKGQSQQSSQQMPSSSSSSSSSSSLQHSQPSSSSSSSSSFSGPRGVYNPVGLSNAGLSLQQHDIMRAQDELLDEIGSGVDRLYMQAQMINDEASVHSRLIDSLDDNVDVAARALREEAKHASEIRARSQSCYLYMCVAAELIIILLLVIAWFAA